MKEPQNTILQAANLAHEALEQLGWLLDKDALTNKIQTLNLGLPAEDEFSMLISWMGKCKIVHKLDEEQAPPSSKTIYRVPDLLAIFEHNGKSIPVLIEVKVSKDKVLNWRPDYLDNLQNYAQEVGIPLLVAWKCSTYNLWTLFEPCHFTRPNKNYRITFANAMKNTLLGLLAGDFCFAFAPGFGVHFQARKLQQLEQPDPNMETWSSIIDDVYFTDSKGNRLNRVQSQLQHILLLLDLEEKDLVTETHLIKSFFIASELNMLFAQSLLHQLLALVEEKEGIIYWRSALNNYNIPLEFDDLKSAIQRGIQEKIIHCIIDTLPMNSPTFIQ